MSRRKQLKPRAFLKCKCVQCQWNSSMHIYVCSSVWAERSRTGVFACVCRYKYNLCEISIIEQVRVCLCLCPYMIDATIHPIPFQSNPSHPSLHGSIQTSAQQYFVYSLVFEPRAEIAMPIIHFGKCQEYTPWRLTYRWGFGFVGCLTGCLLFCAVSCVIKLSVSVRSAARCFPAIGATRQCCWCNSSRCCCCCCCSRWLSYIMHVLVFRYEWIFKSFSIFVAASTDCDTPKWHKMFHIQRQQQQQRIDFSNEQPFCILQLHPHTPTHTYKYKHIDGLLGFCCNSKLFSLLLLLSSLLLLLLLLLMLLLLPTHPKIPVWNTKQKGTFIVETNPPWNESMVPQATERRQHQPNTTKTSV